MKVKINKLEGSLEFWLEVKLKRKITLTKEKNIKNEDQIGKKKNNTP